jgi:VanZ family protein
VIRLLQSFQRLTGPYAVQLVVFSTALILFGTLTPGTKLWESTLWDYDKIGHAGLFFGWTWNVCLMLEHSFKQKAGMMLGVLAAVVFGGLIEVLQATLPINRGADVADLAADILGGVTGAGLYVKTRVEAR